jgi:hypothetical protein
LTVTDYQETGSQIPLSDRKEQKVSEKDKTEQLKLLLSFS